MLPVGIVDILLGAEERIPLVDPSLHNALDNFDGIEVW